MCALQNVPACTQVFIKICNAELSYTVFIALVFTYLQLKSGLFVFSSNTELEFLLGNRLS